MIEERTPARGRYGLRLSARELEQCRAASQVLGLRVSAFIRSDALAAARAQINPATVRVTRPARPTRRHGASGRH